MNKYYLNGEKIMEQTILRIQNEGTNLIAAEYAAEYIKLYDEMRKKYILPKTMTGMRDYAKEFIGFVKAEKMAGLLQEVIEENRLQGYDPDGINRALREQGFKRHMEVLQYMPWQSKKKG